MFDGMKRTCPRCLMRFLISKQTRLKGRAWRCGMPGCNRRSFVNSRGGEVMLETDLSEQDRRALRDAQEAA